MSLLKKKNPILQINYYNNKFYKIIKIFDKYMIYLKK